MFCGRCLDINPVDPSLSQMESTHNDVMMRWRAAANWPALIELNKQYIRLSQAGKSISTPYYPGPLDTETTELIPGLLRLHDYGLLTTGSQPACSGKEPPIRDIDKLWYQYKQWPFVDFVLLYEGEATEKFFSDLINNHTLITQIIDYRSRQPALFPGSFDGSFTFTYVRRAEFPDELSNMAWIKSIGLPGPTISFEDAFFDGMNPALSDKLLWCIVTTKYDIDLLGLVERYAANAGLSKG